MREKLPVHYSRKTKELLSIQSILNKLKLIVKLQCNVPVQLLGLYIEESKQHSTELYAYHIYQDTSQNRQVINILKFWNQLAISKVFLKISLSNLFCSREVKLLAKRHILIILSLLTASCLRMKESLKFFSIHDTFMTTIESSYAVYH